MSTIKAISLTKLRSVIANMTEDSVAKVNQFIIQHVAESFDKQDLIVDIYSAFQPQLYTLNIVDNVERIVEMLGLNNGQREQTLDFVRGMYESFHGDNFCPDYIEHWGKAGIVVEDYVQSEVRKTYDMVTQPDKVHKGLSQIGGLRDMLEGIFNFGSTEFSPEVITTQRDAIITEELEYLTENDDVEVHQMDKLLRALINNDLTKYAKLMKKYGAKMKHYKIKNGEVVVKKAYRDLQAQTVVETQTNKPMNKWEELLRYEVPTDNPMEEITLLDQHYLEHGVTYEHPLCFDKVMSKLAFRRAHNQITAEEFHTELRKILDKVLGELSEQVFLQDTEEGFALGVKQGGMMGMMLKTQIMSRLQNTKILN